MIGFKTGVTIMAAAIVSGVLTYFGFTAETAADDWNFKTVSALTAVVITLVISTFWAYAFAILPHLSKGKARIAGWAITASGLALILAVSTQWNVVYLAERPISQEMSKGITAFAETALARSAERSTKYASYLTDLRAYEAATDAIREREIGGQGVSSEPGEGPLSDLMLQGREAISAVLKSVETAANSTGQLQAAGEACLSDLRRHLSVSDMEAAGKAVACINRSISGIAGQDVLSSIERALRNLTSGIVVPSKIRTAAQKENARNFLTQRQAQANRIADQIAAEPPLTIAPLTMQRDSLMKGILLHWSSIIPQIATALAIDLLPLVLLLYQTTRGDDQRAQGKPRQIWTASDLEDALRQMEALRGSVQPAAKLDLPDDDFIDLEDGAYRDVTDDDPAKSGEAT